MGTIYDNPGIKRFGKPHIHTLPSSGYMLVIHTMCRDKKGILWNRLAVDFAEARNDRKLNELTEKVDEMIGRIEKLT